MCRLCEEIKHLDKDVDKILHDMILKWIILIHHRKNNKTKLNCPYTVDLRE